MLEMKYQNLLKEIRLETSEAAIADKEGATVRAKACLLRIKDTIISELRKG